MALSALKVVGKWTGHMLVLVLVGAVLMACQPAMDEGSHAPADNEPPSFAEQAEHMIERLLTHSPEWAISRGRYEWAGVTTIPNEAQRDLSRDLYETLLAELQAMDLASLSPEERVDHALLTNRFESALWYQDVFKGWQWMPSSYNVARPLSLLLNTPFAPEDERLRLVKQRLAAVPAYYAAARANIDRPTLEHTQLAITQNQGALTVLDEGLMVRVNDSGLSASERAQFELSLNAARAAIGDWIDWLGKRYDELEASGEARPFRIGAELYEQKFAHDIQASFTAAELYQRALEEKDRLLAEMDDITVALWPTYFPEAPMPELPVERIGRLIDHLSDRHVALEDFVDEIRRQIPLLEAFVRDNDLLDQDPDKPLIVRETPPYMRGTGAIASVSAPGPFNPGADTFYNITPLEHFGEEAAASYLREYNHWVLQVLNIHEAIPGHYTQLLHANRSPSLVKSLFGNGAMIEGWAVYAERMMLEEGWGDHEPELWLMYGKWALRVVHNAILDYAVQVLGMEAEEAIAMMREEAFQEASEATQKWRRLTLSQVQLTSYFSGFAEIYAFREQEKARLGEDFNLRDFHNTFLSFGSAPVAKIIDLMEERAGVE